MIPELDPQRVKLLAAAVALIVAFGLYNVLGRRYLGPDDDFWSPLRHWLFPRLEPYVGKSFGGYATGTQQEGRAVGIVYAHPDEVERILYEHGFIKGPLAAAKSHPQYGESYGSWHRREVRHEALSGLMAALENIPVLAGFGFTLQQVLPLRQTHVRLYETENGDCAVYADEEWNAMNPLTAYAHYKGTRGGRILNRLGVEMPPHREELGKERAFRILQGADPDITVAYAA